MSSTICVWFWFDRISLISQAATVCNMKLGGHSHDIWEWSCQIKFDMMSLSYAEAWGRLCKPEFDLEISAYI